jgi:hypothetical protein
VSQAEVHGLCAEVIALGQLVLDDIALHLERIDQLLHGSGALAQAAADIADAEAVWAINDVAEQNQGAFKGHVTHRRAPLETM